MRGKERKLKKNDWGNITGLQEKKGKEGAKEVRRRVTRCYGGGRRRRETINECRLKSEGPAGSSSER